MPILALDSALARCSATIASEQAVIATCQEDVERDHAALLPPMVRDCLRQAGLTMPEMEAVAVTVGPGGFTGIRAALALALGLGQAVGRPVVGVTVDEALADSLPDLGGRRLWCVVPSRRGRVFLERDGERLSLGLEDLPLPDAPVAIAGSAAIEVASRLAAKGADVQLTDARLPVGWHIAQVGYRRLRGAIPPCPPLPLYIDAPEAKPQRIPE